MYGDGGGQFSSNLEYHKKPTNSFLLFSALNQSLDWKPSANETTPPDHTPANIGTRNFRLQLQFTEPQRNASAPPTGPFKTHEPRYPNLRRNSKPAFS